MKTPLPNNPSSDREHTPTCLGWNCDCFENDPTSNVSSELNPNACYKHQDKEVYGEYGQRGCEACVLTKKLVLALHHQQLLAVRVALPEKWHKGGTDPLSYMEAYNLHNKTIDQIQAILDTQIASIERAK